VEIDSDGLIRGAGSDEFPTIRLATEDGAVIDNDEDGVIRGDDYASTDLIVRASGGDVEINNRGEMFGRIDLSYAGSTEYGNVVNNISPDSWTFTGTSEFGGGLADALNNTGAIHTTDPDYAESASETVFAGLESFSNGEEGEGGGSGTIDMQDGFTGDVTILRPTEYGELTFSGIEGRSFVSLDAFLQGPAAEDNSADLLVIEGMATGRTQLNVVNLNPSAAFLDLEGVKVVQADASGGEGTEFFLAEPVEAGLFDYGLFFDDAGQTDDWYLRGGVNGSGQALGSLHTGIASLFTTGAGPWTERTTELHDIVASGHGPVSLPVTNGPNAGVWGTIFGGARDHDATFTTTIDTYDGSYRQSALGFLAGIDTIVDTEGEGTWLAGVAGGYLTSSLGFATEGARGGMRGGSVGGYVSYMNGGFFTDVLVKADFLSVAFSAGGSTSNSSGRAVGVLADLGYRMDSNDMFFEPIGTLSYVNVSTSSFELLGTDILFPNSNNLLGRLGARAGSSAFSNAEARVDTFVSASVWNNFTGGNAATIVGGGGGEVTVVNAGSGLYFEVGAGVEVVSLVNGMSGFIRGDYQFGDSISGGSGRGGLRMNW
jgi:outer membrane autotransporter protein